MTVSRAERIAGKVVAITLPAIQLSRGNPVIAIGSDREISTHTGFLPAVAELKKGGP
jgi:hypothetical protein